MKFYISLLTFWPLAFCFSCEQSIEGIDKIYLINLDSRADRLNKVQSTLQEYEIAACRFPAIDGHKISFDTLIDIAFICEPELSSQRWLTTPLKDGTLSYTLLSKNAKPMPVFSEWMSIGAVGCALSHLSILKEAYELEYETIWVLEDDILILKNPNILSKLIKELDSLTNKEWDILYTDSDEIGLENCSPETFWWMWRPDFDQNISFTFRQKLNDTFTRIGSRSRTHSMIIRRSGIKKILDHFEKHRLFLPIDHEIAFAKDIILYMLSDSVVTFNTLEDTNIQKVESLTFINHDELWSNHKENVINNLSLFPGWCNSEKAECLMDFLYKRQDHSFLCVEIGTFGGSTSFPIISTLKYFKKGHLYTIDAWNHENALEGLTKNDPNYLWWSNVNFEFLKDNFKEQLSSLNLSEWCTIIHDSSSMAVNNFKDNSIDMLFIDGNFSEIGSFQDLILYFPKVKKGGYIWLNDANSFSKRSSIGFLIEKCDFIAEESLRNSCVVFQKKY